MGHSSTFDAIVLKTHDVGEGDRFCILFTKQRGKMAARARGARKLGSKLGGHLLPMRHVELTIREGSGGILITDAKRLSEEDEPLDITAFLQVQQGIELLIASLQDDEPLPELFAITLQFLTACHAQKTHTVLPFTLALLQQSGLLPEHSDPYFHRYSDTQKYFMQQSVQGAWDALPVLSAAERNQFSTHCAELLSELIHTPLKAGKIAGMLMNP